MSYTFLSKKNNAQSTLSGNMLVTDTTALVTSLAPFPQFAPFMCTLWNITLYPDPSNDPNMEIIRVTSISSGNTFTIVRAQENTLARAHAVGINIGHFWSAAQAQEHETQINLKGTVYRLSFTNSDLSSGYGINVNHNLSQTYVHVMVYDNNHNVIIPDGITAFNSNNLYLYLNSFGPISGTWNLIVTG